MSAQVEHLDTHEARLSIPVSPADLTAAQRVVAARLSKEFRFPGFRPGKVPINTVMSVVGADAFGRELADELARKLYPKALDESGISPYGPGALEDMTMDPPTLIARVPKMPVVDLKDYQTIRVPFETPVVSDEEIEAQLNSIQEDNAIVEALDRPAAAGDFIEGKVVAYNDDNEALFDLNEKSFILNEEIENTLHLPGLVGQIEGMGAGANKSTSMKIGDSEEDEALRGREVRVEISIERVNRRELPPIDDTLAQTIGSYENIEQLKTRIREQLGEYKVNMANREYQDKVLDTFSATSTITLPPNYMEERTEDAMKEFQARIKRDENLDYADWLKLNAMSDEQARAELAESVSKQARTNLVLGGLRNAEGTTLDEAELNAALDRQLEFAKQSGVDLAKTVKRPEFRENLANRLLTDKVLSRMMAIAKGEAA